MLSLTLIQLAVVALVTIQKVSHATGANIVDFEDKFVTTAVISINGHLMRLDNVASRRLLEAAAAANLTLQTPEEADYLQFHRCFGKHSHQSYQNLKYSLLQLQMRGRHMQLPT